MNAVSAAKLIVDVQLQRFLPLARRRIETTQAQYLRPSDPSYVQVLDSLAMIARHRPVPLLEALLRWRERLQWSAYFAQHPFVSRSAAHKRDSLVYNITL